MVGAEFTTGKYVLIFSRGRKTQMDDSQWDCVAVFLFWRGGGGIPRVRFVFTSPGWGILPVDQLGGWLVGPLVGWEGFQFKQWAPRI